jgi:hypothetical protein
MKETLITVGIVLFSILVTLWIINRAGREPEDDINTKRNFSDLWRGRIK